MKSKIDVLDEREDIVKTEFERYRAGDGDITIEMWHDAEGLQRIVERMINGIATSQKGVEKLAKEQALATRETEVDLTQRLDLLYPKVTDSFEEEN